MDCKTFREWLTFRDSVNTDLSEELQEHTQACAACHRLLIEAEKIDKALVEEFQRIEAPGRLRKSVAMIAEEKQRWSLPIPWPRLVIPSSALAGLALLLLVYLPFSSDLTSIEKIARLAEKNHHAGFTMDFKAAAVGDVSGWFRGKLPFEVAMPDLSGRGLKLLGGRKCSIGSEEAAYLFYSKDGVPHSLFEIDAGDVHVEMLEDKVYRYPVGDCTVELWKSADKVFVLVV